MNVTGGLLLGIVPQVVAGNTVSTVTMWVIYVNLELVLLLDSEPGPNVINSQILVIIMAGHVQYIVAICF
jgi:hypothetical protein